MQYRLLAVLLATVLFVIGVPVQAQLSYDTDDYEQTLAQLIDDMEELRISQTFNPNIFEAIGDSGDPLYIAPLVDIGYFVRGPNPLNDVIMQTLAEISGEDFGNDWQAYFEYAGRENIDLPPGYDTFKGDLLGVLIDPRFRQFFEDGVQDTATVNLSEAVWGGVAVDGIPSLVNAKQISPEEAAEEGETLTEFCRTASNGPEGEDCSYPADDEYVFGVFINGDARAYPLRQLNWHEMFNDVIGKTPFYDAPDGEVVCDFRAPATLRALARSGDSWIQVRGDSANCPTEGWVTPDDIVWLDEDEAVTDFTWDDVGESLPDVEADEDALAFDDGVLARVDGMPVMLAYCTLCGSGVLYDATIPDLTYTDLEGEEVELGDTVLEFGSTGMLMRSNKLMYDRNTNTVWNALTGEPAFGPLAGDDIQLEILPVVVTDWASWLEQHPDTSVLSLRTGFRRDYTNGAAYSDYFNNPDFVMFPVWQQDTTDQGNKEVVFGLMQGGERKAYPLATIIPEQVTNDTLGGEDVVLVTQETPQRDFFEPGGAAVRAYYSEGITFSPTDDPFVVEDADGNLWDVTETALVGSDGEELRRIGGHLAFWFGWYAFFPDTLVYEGTA